MALMSRIRLGALGGDDLVRANTVVDALFGRWSELQRLTAEAVARGELPQARMGEINALQPEIQQLTDQVSAIEIHQLESWTTWAADINARLRTFEGNNRLAIENARRIRAIRVGLGFGAVAIAAGAIGYVIWRNRKGSRG